MTDSLAEGEGTCSEACEAESPREGECPMLPSSGVWAGRRPATLLTSHSHRKGRTPSGGSKHWGTRGQQGVN